MAKNNFRIIALRVFSVLLVLFSLAFGVTWGKNNFCLGDRVLASLGLPVWSNGTQGTHYPAIIALILLIGGMYLFAATTEKKIRTLRILIVGIIALVVLLNFLSFLV